MKPASSTFHTVRKREFGSSTGPQQKRQSLRPDHLPSAFSSEPPEPTDDFESWRRSARGGEFARDSGVPAPNLTVPPLALRRPESRLTRPRVTIVEASERPEAHELSLDLSWPLCACDARWRASLSVCESIARRTSRSSARTSGSRSQSARTEFASTFESAVQEIAKVSLPVFTSSSVT